MVEFTWQTVDTIIITKNFTVLELEVEQLLNIVQLKEIHLEHLKVLIFTDYTGKREYLFMRLINVNFVKVWTLDAKEWDKLCAFASDLTPPLVEDEHCILCSTYTVCDFHYDCDHIKKRVPLYLELSKSEVDVLFEMTRCEVPVVLREFCDTCQKDRVYGAYCLCSNIRKNSLDIKYIDIAYGRISFASIKLFSSETLFRSVKTNLRSIITNRVLESFDEEEMPQSLDWYVDDLYEY